MFRTSPGPSSGGTSVFMRHWYVLFCIADCLVYRMEFQIYRMTSIKCCKNTVVIPDDGPGEVRNM